MLPPSGRSWLLHLNAQQQQRRRLLTRAHQIKKRGTFKQSVPALNGSVRNAICGLFPASCTSRNRDTQPSEVPGGRQRGGS